ncbi:MAG: hypothetical protein JNJ43_19230, partial [Anaerolineales bacterium]|nr:hypothetical protein [Anaerolineales bacterium]
FVVVDGPALESLCLALIVTGAIVVAQQNPDVMQEVIEECTVTWEILLNNVAPNPNTNQEPTPKPIESVQPPPPRIPVGTP